MSSLRWIRLSIMLVALALAGCASRIPGQGAATASERNHATGLVRDSCPVDLEAGFQAGANADAVITGDNERPVARTILGWETDWSRHTIDYDEILSGGVPRDGIPALTEPDFVSIGEAEEWLADIEPVGMLQIGDDVRAYPLQILTWHEIANDTVCGVPVLVTFCPLCNSLIAFDRRVNGEVYEFGVSGLLRHSDLIMYDRNTESLWQQFTGEGIVGEHAGDQLAFLPVQLISFGEFKTAYPDGLVLSRKTGFSKPYGVNPYEGYDTLSRQPFLFRGELDARLPPMLRVVGIEAGEVHRAYPYPNLAGRRVINDTVGNLEIAIFFAFGTTSALDADQIAESEDVGAATVFSPYVDGKKLVFIFEGEQIKDTETGSVWTLAGKAISGPLMDKQLAPIVHNDHFWFSWAAFFPDTEIYQ